MVNAYLRALLCEESARLHAVRWDRWRASIASLPHEPFWNLLPFGGRGPRVIPWECGWHGAVSAERCAECHRECAEYRATGTWATRR